MSSSIKVGLVLVICYLVAWLDRMAINIAMPFIAKDLDVGPDKVGWMLSAFFLGYAICQVPGGLLADRYGPRIVILCALAWWTLFTGMTGAVTSLTMLLVVRFLFGLGEGMFPASVWKVLGQQFTTKNRATANSLVLSSIALGPALTPLLLVPFISLWGWRAAFAALGVAGLFALVLAHRFIHNAPEASTEGSTHTARVESASPPRSSLREVVSSPVVWALFFTALAGNVTMYGWLNWLPSYLINVKGLDFKGMAMAASVPFMFGAVGCMLAGYVSDRWFRERRKVLVLVCQVLGGLALFGFTQVDDVTGFMALQCIAAFLLFMSCGAIWAMPMVLLPPRWMGSGSGFINMGGQIGGFITNIIIGYVITWSGGDYAAGFNVLFGGLVVSAACVLFGVRTSPARSTGIAPL